MARLSLAGLGLGVLLAAPASAQDFIRGDSNEDGVVTLADSHRTLYLLFVGGEALCGDAADFDNSGKSDISDPIKNMRYQVLNGAPPPSPFPGLGPDNGAPDALSCDAYGGGEPVEDPEATIRVLDTVVQGGEDLEATILLAISSSKRIAGYMAEIDAGGTIAPTQLSYEAGGVSNGLFDLTGTLNAGFLGAATNPDTDRLRVGFLSTFIGELFIAPGESDIVLEVNVCLEPGTPPGDYPLALTMGELVEYGSGSRIDPVLLPGTLTIADPLPSVDCSIERTDPTSKSQLDIVFELGEASGAPGSLVEVPFSITTTDQALTRGLSFSIDFDETALELVDVTTVLARPDDDPWLHESFQAQNTDGVPGSGSDEGYATGRYTYDSGYPAGDVTFPVNEEFTALALVFEVKPDASLGTADVTFRDGYDFCQGPAGETHCYPMGNRLVSAGADLSPNLVSSFVLVNGLINIVPDVTIFRRGDSNGDRAVDISDALNTLGYLFLGERRPACFDAADANDDGKLDIADPIGTLEHLFSGGGPLPPPSDEPGEDPTEDGITCSSQG